MEEKTASSSFSSKALSGSARAQRIDGKAIAAGLRQEIAVRVSKLTQLGKRAPCLAVILVGENPASEVYVAAKVKQTQEVGMVSREYKRVASISEAELLNLIEEINKDEGVDGLLVQLPLPQHMDERKILEAIDPKKDVDGFHPINVGRLATGGDAFVPCTPRGAVRLIKSVRSDLAGLEAVIVGRSNIVGKPMAQLLLQENCTVTIAHSRTRNLAELCQRADILVAAIGKPRFIDGDFVKEGAIVIDVGINREVNAAGKAILCGDVDYASASMRADAITPVPGGVGPMTIACLLENTLEAYEKKFLD